MSEFDALRRYRDLNLPVWVHDPHEHRQVWANAAGLRFWRADSLEELRSRSYSDMSEAALARLSLAMQAHARGETTRERWTLYPRGVPEAVQLHGSAVALPDGRPGILFIAEPPDAQDPQLLRGVEALLHTPMLVALHELDTGAVLYRNPAAELALGPVAEHRGWGACFVDGALAAETIAAARDGRISRLEAQLSTRAGPKWFFIDVRITWDPVSGRRAVQLNGHDISELKAVQAALQAATEAAQAANHAKSAFLANMSHEIRTPLNGVLGVVQLLERSPISPEQRRWLEIARDSGHLLLCLLNDVLDLSKIEAGRMEIDRVRFDVRELIGTAVGPLSIDARQRGLEWQLTIDPSVPAEVVGDPIRLRQVLLNLVGNAVKFTERGRVGLNVSIRDGGPGVRELTIEVRDTGIGISAEALPRLFSPFSQVDSSVSRRFGGSGLGLSIVDRLVRLMGGQVSIDSEPGRGTCVRCTVQVQAPPNTPAQAA